MLNDINLAALKDYAATISENPKEGISSYGITAKWMGGVQSEISTHNQFVGSKEVVKNFRFTVGEPEELLGDNKFPTPQDYLLGGMAGCMMVGFVILASDRNIKLESVELKIVGSLNLLGMLELDPLAPVGFPDLAFNFNVVGNGTQEQYDEIIRHVQKISPNYRTICDSVKISINGDI
ncbi:OsmC family protein [Sphingobacterium sp. WOUb80]|uniref:OsmC family protein n=1 Tax=Sphingobacterium sp. WOUb80 TaxID=3234028 RepID=UPI003CEB764A